MSKYGFDLTKLTLEQIEAMIYLVAEDQAWLYYDKNDDDNLELLVNLNDTFCYATCDAETVTPQEAVELAHEVSKFEQNKWVPIILFAQKKRGGIPFLLPVQQHLEKVLKEMKEKS